ncbi:Lysophospholipase, alpha-beta hydrolase superfamily [Microlunatus sagamiharensis]|uniref:Lysophospholipase, alpha-beta hydrolase superfamily n=1 Tax=Microlunatus sagamiharensis TaxID=546874 RepID=A0A1H2LVT6_9ACTN|nr:alpha/beta hydrolase [Microlunatus sagamiharensis]SDU84436.1 Lysophospholipase, alpha-beta hydrolase superfamily [Microlunatus sagamiharensis]
MTLQEISFTSANGRDTVQAWVYEPVVPATAVVQVVHGLGEHSRRYLHLVTTLLDAGVVVVAGDHAGHGRTAMESGVWADAGDDAARVVVADELTLQAKARALLGDGSLLPWVVYGHSWGSMIARAVATDPEARLSGLVLGGIAAQMHGMEQVLDRPALAALATGDHAADPAPAELVGQLFDGFLDRYGPGAGPTAWVALDADVVADHARDPFNNFGAPLSARFLQGFVDLYDQVNGDDWYAHVPADLPVLVLAGDQDPVTNYGEGAYHVANRLVRSGHADVRTRVFTGVRHEVHNEPTTRAEAEREITDFVARVTDQPHER